MEIHLSGPLTDKPGAFLLKAFIAFVHLEAGKFDGEGHGHMNVITGEQLL